MCGNEDPALPKEINKFFKAPKKIMREKVLNKLFIQILNVQKQPKKKKKHTHTHTHYLIYKDSERLSHLYDFSKIIKVMSADGLCWNHYKKLSNN